VVEQGTLNPLVPGSNPGASTKRIPFNHIHLPLCLKIYSNFLFDCTELRKITKKGSKKEISPTVSIPFNWF
jgi:hypothetical protein